MKRKPRGVPRRSATGAIALFAAGLAAASLPPSTIAMSLSSPRASSATVCHRRGNGTYDLLSLAASGVPAHLAHGDGQPLGLAGEGQVFDETCQVVASVAGVWVGRVTEYDPDACGQDRDEMRLTLAQSGSDVTGEIYTRILESFFPPDVGKERTHPLTSGQVSGNTFTFTYGSPEQMLEGTATFTATEMTGTVVFAPSSCQPNSFVLTRQ